MNALLSDAFDLLRFRVGPLTNYQYSLPTCLAALLLMAAASAASAPELGGSAPGRMAFFLLFSGAQMLLYTRFIAWWMTRAGTPPQAPLFGLVVAANLFQALEVLTSWLPADSAEGAATGLALLGMAVLVHALARVSGASHLRIFLGTLLFSPIAVALLVGMFQLGDSLGWINAEVLEEQGAALMQDAAPAPQGSSSAAADKAV